MDHVPARADKFACSSAALPTGALAVRHNFFDFAFFLFQFDFNLTSLCVIMRA